jgi:ubiquinone/menaquinone biosynthesis C-methylase UbiE
MNFNKYQRWGTYHWKWYGYGAARLQSYVDHVDRVKRWIKEKKVLDVGAGDGLITHVLGAEGIDNDQTAVLLARKKGANVILGDAYQLPYKDNEFEAVFLGDTLEHLDNPERALQEARRVLSKHLYIAIPQKAKTKDIWQYHDWTPVELKTMVEKQDFQLVGEVVLANHKLYAKFKKL